MDEPAHDAAPTPPPKRRRSFFPWRAMLLIASVLVLVMLSRSSPPENLGVHAGRFAPCPGSPNCASTQAERESQRCTPLLLSGEAATARSALREILGEMPRTRVVADEGDYVRAECRSRLLRFVDDLEVWIDEQAGLIHARSASRVGYSDLGANRKRVEQLFSRLIEQGVAVREPQA